MGEKRQRAYLARGTGCRDLGLGDELMDAVFAVRSCAVVVVVAGERELA